MAPTEKKGGGAFEKKWTDDAERDLIISMLCCSAGSGSNIKVDWSVVVNSMKELGYDFTKDAITLVSSV